MQTAIRNINSRNGLSRSASVSRRDVKMDSRHRPRLLIADDHTLLAEACKGLLEPEFEVVGIADNGRALLRMAADLKPEVVILDISMPQLNGLDAADQIKQFLPKTKFVFLTMNLSPEIAAEAFRRGASGYVVKTAAAEELLRATRRAVRSESYLSPSITKETVDFLLRSGRSGEEEKKITQRQREVLQLLAEGRSMKEIAGVLNLKPGTVAFHKYRMMEALGIKTNAELLQYAIKHHIVGS